MKTNTLEKQLIKVGISKDIAQKMSLKLTMDYRKKKSYTKNKWGDINKKYIRIQKRKLSLKAKDAEKKMRKTLKYIKKNEAYDNKSGNNNKYS